MYFLDTHAVIWLYQGEIEKFPEALKEILNEHDLYVSPIVKLELQYLHEVKRIKVKPIKVLDYLYSRLGVTPHNVPLNLLIEASLKESWTREPFDRLIVAHAKMEQGFVITCDQTIQKNYAKALW